MKKKLKKPRDGVIWKQYGVRVKQWGKCSVELRQNDGDRILAYPEEALKLAAWLTAWAKWMKQEGRS